MRVRLTTVLVVVLLTSSLGGCGPDWRPYVSPNKALAFITIVSCAWPIKSLPSHAMFHPVRNSYPTAGGLGVHTVTFMTLQGQLQTEPLQIIYTQTIDGALYDVAPGYEVRKRCGAYVGIPWSDRINRPFYLEDQPAKVAQKYGALVAAHWCVFFCLCCVVLLGCISSWHGFEGDPEHKRVIAAACGLAGVLFCELTAAVNVLAPWSTIKQALDYYAFYDALPRNAQGLLPLSDPQLMRLWAGPPHPSQIKFSFEPYAIAAGTFLIIWIVVLLRPIIEGIYWLRVPLPLAQLHEQALARGQPPSVDEITSALNQTVEGKETWQLNVLRRKAQAFAKSLGTNATKG
jgi:hypothetical protein